MKKSSERKVLFLDPFSGISGDMFLGSLLDMGLDEDWFRERVGRVLPRGTEVKIWKDSRGGMRGTRFAVEDIEDTEARHLQDILDLLERSGLEEEIVAKSEQAFDLLAKVEGEAHGMSKEEVHFHEVGALDSIADIVGAAAAVWKMNLDAIYSAPVNVGGGTVQTAHGELPVPAPATAKLLQLGEVPTYSSGVESELTTPTGALILNSFVDEFRRPAMVISGIGYGLGSREIEGRGNFLRASLGYVETATSPQGGAGDHELLMETNIDDMNPELYPEVEEKLLESGALDVFKTPIQMKKNRPGVRLSVICAEEDRRKLAEIIFRETTTLGIRVHRMEREKLDREKTLVETSAGPVEMKVGYWKGERVNFSPEFESCKRLAGETGRPVKEIYREALGKALEEE